MLAEMYYAKRLLILGAAFLLGPKAVESNGCPGSGWTPFDNTRCYMVKEDSVNFNQAREACWSFGGDLAVIPSAAANDFLLPLSGNHAYWIGIYDANWADGSSWVTNEPVIYTQWATGEPNNHDGNEACAHWYGDYGSWNDIPCDLNFPYICISDRDECAINVDSCDINAQCTNKYPGYDCTCLVGYLGNGYTCIDKDECSLNQYACPENSECQNTIGNYQCVCVEGFAEDGGRCVDVDECDADTHDCDVNAHCLNKEGTHNCSCNQGYEGDGWNCTDVNECSSNQFECHQYASCQNTVGGYDCSCDEGYYGNGKVCTVAIEVICNGGSITVRVAAQYFIDRNIARDQLHLNDYSCSGDVDSASPDHWLFEIPTLSSCGNAATSNDTHVEYENTLSKTVSPGLYVGRGFTSTFSCVYQKNLDLSLFSVQYGVVQNVREFVGPQEVGDFTVSMNHYSDGSHQHLENKTQFEADDTLYIQMQLHSAPANLHLVIEECWVTPTADNDHPLRYAFIRDSCPVGGDSGNVQITKSGEGLTADFSSKVFAFVDYETTFLHCSLFICSSNETCVPTCLTDRRKRSLVRARTLLKRTKRQTDEDKNGESEILSIGPFTVVRGDADDMKAPEPSPNPQSPASSDGLSTSTLLIVVVAVVVLVLASLSFAAFWFKNRRGHSAERKLDAVSFSNPALEKD